MNAPFITDSMKRGELVKAYPSWPNRFEAFRFAAPPILIGVLESIADEAETEGDDDWQRAAQAAADGLRDGVIDFDELHELIREQDAEEALNERHYAYEIRHGREVPYDMAIAWGDA